DPVGGPGEAARVTEQMPAVRSCRGSQPGGASRGPSRFVCAGCAEERAVGVVLRRRFGIERRGVILTGVPPMRFQETWPGRPCYGMKDVRIQPDFESWRHAARTLLRRDVP